MANTLPFEKSKSESYTETAGRIVSSSFNKDHSRSIYITLTCLVSAGITSTVPQSVSRITLSPLNSREWFCRKVDNPVDYFPHSNGNRNCHERVGEYLIKAKLSGTPLDIWRGASRIFWGCSALVGDTEKRSSLCKLYTGSNIYIDREYNKASKAI
jgi:hypothetical protein